MYINVRLEICFQTFSGVLQMGIFDNVLGKKKKEMQKGGIVCPYCAATQNSDTWSFSDKKNFKNWLVRARCIKCGIEYWIVGSYDKAYSSRRIGM